MPPGRLAESHFGRMGGPRADEGAWELVEAFERLLGSGGDYGVEVFDGVQGLVMDCDGTLVNSMQGHYEVWQRALNDFGIRSFTKDHFYAFGGMPVGDILDIMVEEEGCAPIDKEAFADRKMDLFHDIALPLVAEIRVCVDIVRCAKKEGLKVAVASGGDKLDVVSTLKRTGLFDLFDAIVTREDTPRGKPAPDPFLLAAELINADPTKCIGFEDADKGLEAVRRAGMKAVDVRRFDAYPLPEYFVRTRPELRTRPTRQ